MCTRNSIPTSAAAGSTSPSSLLPPTDRQCAPGCLWHGSAWCWEAWFECPGGRFFLPVNLPRLPDASMLPQVPSWSTPPWWSTAEAPHAQGHPQTSAGCRGRKGQRARLGLAKRSGRTQRATGKRSPPGTWRGTSRPRARRQQGEGRVLESWWEMWGWSSGWGLRLWRKEIRYKHKKIIFLE